MRRTYALQHLHHLLLVSRVAALEHHLYARCTERFQASLEPLAVVLDLARTRREHHALCTLLNERFRRHDAEATETARHKHRTVARPKRRHRRRWLNTHNHLSDVLAALQSAERFHKLAAHLEHLHWQRPRVLGFDVAGEIAKHRHQLLGLGGQQLVQRVRLVEHVWPNLLHLLLAPDVALADLDEPAILSDQRDGRVDVPIRSQRVENHVHAPVTDHLLHFSLEHFRVTRSADELDAQRSEEVVLWCACRRVHFCADALGVLNRRDAHAAGG
mmetsp:Transcript_69643/g.157461  ORF Transcript_69643/g.157461 Transcript_69643/m.157461 type:complete len:273 (-) Transcript_69643:207-1025(-)